MAEHYAPNSTSEAARIIADAFRHKVATEVIGGATRRKLGGQCRKFPYHKGLQELSLAQISGIINYEPHELVLTASAGTKLADIQSLLATEGQELIGDPLLVHPLFESEGAGEESTFGGAIATGLSGPKRFCTGSIRDGVLGVEAIDGRGEIFRSGGRVVKNVTGYDLSRLVVGSFGTLAAITEISVKTRPKNSEATVLVTAPYGMAITDMMQSVRRSNLEPVGLCWLERDTLSKRLEALSHLHSDLEWDEPAAEGALCVRLEGLENTRKAHIAATLEHLNLSAALLTLEQKASEDFWALTRDNPASWMGDLGKVRGKVGGEDGQEEKLLWRVVGLPNEWQQILTQNTLPNAKVTQVDWGGAISWIETYGSYIPVVPSGGSMSLICGSHAQWTQEESAIHRKVGNAAMREALWSQMTKVKTAFDPELILSPGRLTPRW